jgi:hypothetical protein
VAVVVVRLVRRRANKRQWAACYRRLIHAAVGPFTSAPRSYRAQAAPGEQGRHGGVSARQYRITSSGLACARPAADGSHLERAASAGFAAAAIDLIIQASPACWRRRCGVCDVGGRRRRRRAIVSQKSFLHILRRAPGSSPRPRTATARTELSIDDERQYCSQAGITVCACVTLTNDNLRHSDQDKKHSRLSPCGCARRGEAI